MCRGLGGRHRPTCNWKHLRPARARLTVRHDVVTEDQILDLYLPAAATAKRVAARVLQPSDVDDVVQDVFVYLLEKREFLTRAPTRKYLFTAVRSTALKVYARWWSRRVLLMTPEELEVAERMLAGGEPEEDEP